MLASHPTSWRDEEELVDYEPDIQPSFSPAVEAISEPEDRVRTPVPGQAGNSSPEYDFGAVTADDAPMAGQKRRPNSPEDELRRKTIRQPLSGEVVSPSLFSKTISSPTYRGPLRGK